MNRKAMTYQHPRNAKCLCGSGKKFKRCCSDRYKSERPADRSFTLFNEKNYGEALLQCRADITRYTIWHRSHTEPPLKDGFEPIKELLHLDIEALSDLVDLLLHCYERVRLLDEFPAVLERLRDNIKHERWHHRIIYFHSLCALLPNWNSSAGRRELRKIGSIDDVEDIKIIQLYLDLFREEIPFSKNLEIIEKVITLADEWIDILQYKSLKAIQYLLIDKVEDAKAILIKAVDEARKSIDEAITAYQAVRTADSMSLLSQLVESEKLLDEAIDLYQRALQDDSWRPSGLAELHRCIGDAWRYKEEWEQARVHYEKSLELSPHNVSLVFLAECQLRSGKLSEAESLLNDVKPEKLDLNEYCDYVFVFSAFSVAHGGRGILQKAEQLLRSTDIREPYFKQRQQDLLISILECRANGPSEGLLKRTFALMNRFVHSASRYVMLQPNIMGLGLNVNRIIADSEQVHRRRDEMASNRRMEHDQ